AEAEAPVVKNPVATYSVDTVKVDGTKVAVALKATAKKYTVTLDGKEVGEYAYQELATVESDTDVTFIVGNKGVTNGKSYTFYVTEDTDITTSATAKVDAFADLSWDATISDNGRVTIELLATANTADFARMGVLFYTSATMQEDALKNAAASYDELGKTKLLGAIAVHNSTVTEANESGQYQFIYAPNTTSTKTVYFRSFAVQKDGTVLLSEAQVVNFANITA
ncbi:MAG: hypothetical protein IJ725_03455, partial [Ruminococcus sp.]|nr:hypothetical protein [Ruminococcus sp.]